MNREDRLVRNIVIGFAIVEAVVIALFIANRLHWIGR